MKLVIKGTIVVQTGMHIGGSSDFSAIGAIDSPVVRDTLTRLPMIPGSTLKGKMRYLLAKALNEGVLLNEANDDPEAVLRLFGSSEKDKIRRSRLKYNDIKLSNQDELSEHRVSPTEIKFENTISRKTAVANPRQIERVIAGSKFDFDIFYNLEDESQVVEDFKNIKYAFDLLAFDYLGGHGTRGSGRIAFEALNVQNGVGTYDKVSELNDILGAL